MEAEKLEIQCRPGLHNSLQANQQREILSQNIETQSMKEGKVINGKTEFIYQLGIHTTVGKETEAKHTCIQKPDCGGGGLTKPSAEDIHPPLSKN